MFDIVNFQGINYEKLFDIVELQGMNYKMLLQKCLTLCNFKELTTKMCDIV